MSVSTTIRQILSVYPVELPVFHPIALKLIHLLETRDYSIGEVVALASQDQLLAARILRTANSPVYRGTESVETLKDAVVRLGSQAVANLAMAASLASLHVSDNELFNRYMHRLWQHSHACALGCRWTANAIGLRGMADQAYLAGLLHDIGKLYLLKVLEKLNRSGVAQSAAQEDALVDVFRELHVEEGAKLVKHWQLPLIYQGAVEKHHASHSNVDDLVLIILQFVNHVCRRHGLSVTVNRELDPALLKEWGLLGFNAERLAGLDEVLQRARIAVV